MPGFVNACSPVQLSMAPADAVMEGPVPVVAPNVSDGVTWIPTQVSVFYDFFLGQNLQTMAPVTIGPPGIGLASGTGDGPGRSILCDPNIILGTAPQTSQLCPNLHNLTNAPALVLSPGSINTMNL